MPHHFRATSSVSRLGHPLLYCKKWSPLFLRGELWRCVGLSTSPISSVGKGECEEGEGGEGVEGNVSFTWISGPLLVGWNEFTSSLTSLLVTDADCSTSSWQSSCSSGTIFQNYQKRVERCRPCRFSDPVVRVERVSLLALASINI